MKTKFTLLTLLSAFLLTSAIAQNTKTADPDFSVLDRLSVQTTKYTSPLDEAKAVEGTLSALSGYVAGETIEIPLVIDFTNVDEEYVDLLEITFPAGVTIEGVSNDVVFADNGVGAPVANFNGIVGQTVSWGDDNNDFGGIFTSGVVGGELVGLSYNFSITVTVAPGTTGDLTVDFFASGDTYDVNGPAADLSGSFTLGEGLSVYGIVVNSEDHNTLETAIDAAGLANALATLDPTTLFAPTDAAFDELEAANPGIIAALLDDPAALANILLYHAANAEAFAADLSDGQEIVTLQENGFTVTITIVGTDVFVNGELVGPADVDASNGVVHVIDGVLIPPTAITIPVDFEEASEAYNIEGFGGAQNTSVVPNPDPTGANTSENVWQQTQNPAAPEPFAGAVLTLDEPIPFDEAPQMAMEVWTPEVGDQVTLKIEDGSGAEFEQVVASTVAGEWETMVFNFSGQFDLALDYPRVVVFFNNGSPNVAETYYSDNIRMEPLPTIFDVVEASEVHTTLEDALIAAGLEAAFDNPAGNFTLFAPTDAAFDLLPDGVLSSLLDDATGALLNVLLYHAVNGTALSTDLSDGLEVLTAQGETVTVTIVGETISINDAEVITEDIITSNGVVHVIDAVLVPEFCAVPNASYDGFFGEVGEDVASAPAAEGGICPIIVSDFEAWASEAYFLTDFVAGTTYTFGLTGGNIGVWTPQLLVVSDATGEIVATGDEGDFTLTFEVPEDGTYGLFFHEAGACGAQSENIQVDGGFPFLTCESSVTITDIVVASDIHTTLEDAVILAGLDGTLAGEGPFTVFAPTDDAFAAVDPDLLATILADPSGLLTETLEHHVVSGIAYSTDLSDGQSVPTLNSENVTVSIDDGNGEITIESALGSVALVVTADIIASNGVVHVVDAVLAPTILGVDELTSVDKLSVFPNPTNNQFTLDIELNASERVTVDLINVVGQVVKSVDLGNRSVGLNREYIDVNDLSEGIYFMNLTVGENQATLKVQVVR